jgi:hypothetical protein
MSKAKRLDYEKAQPKFWSYAGPKAEIEQAKWFAELIKRDDHIALTATDNSKKIIGFIIGRLIPASEVYNPGGMTLMIDDFCVESEDLWETVGKKLIEVIKADLKAVEATQILIVCGSHDKAKKQLLKNMELSVASEWYVGSSKL